MTGPAADGDPELRDPQNTHEQRIRVEDAVAYGVIGANFHVWDNGALENWHDASSAGPGRLRELPGRLLNARQDVAGFTGRAAKLSRLPQWRRDDGRFAVPWLYGFPRAGKTCRAAKFASESTADQWPTNILAWLLPNTLFRQHPGRREAAGAVLGKADSL